MLPNEEEETLGTTGAEDGGGTTVEVASVSGEIGYEECVEHHCDGRRKALFTVCVVH